MDHESTERARELVARFGRERVALALAVLVKEVASEVLPEGAAMLDDATRLDWNDAAARAAFLSAMPDTVDSWMSREVGLAAAIAVQQAAALLDPRVASPETLAAAVIESAALAHSVTTTGMHDAEVCARWEREAVARLSAHLA